MTLQINCKIMKLSHIIYLLIIATLFPTTTIGAENVSIAKADSLYSKAEYRAAADVYRSVIEKDGASAPIYFNLANACAQSNDIGNAILYYSRANRLDPSNDEIKNNLNYFSSKVEDSNRAELRGKKISVSPDPETFFSSAHRLIAADVRSNTWAVWGVVCFILFVGGVALYLFCGNVLLRKTGFFGGITLFVLSIVFVVFAFMSAKYFDAKDSAVLMTYKAELKIEPSADAKPASNLLCQGTVFEIVAEESDVNGKPIWYKVRLNADIEGWLKAEDLEVI